MFVTTSIKLKSPQVLPVPHRRLNDHISEPPTSVMLNHICCLEHCWGFNLSPESDGDKDFQMWEGLLSCGTFPDPTLSQIKSTRLTSIFSCCNVTSCPHPASCAWYFHDWFEPWGSYIMHGITVLKRWECKLKKHNWLVSGRHAVIKCKDHRS